MGWNYQRMPIEVESPEERGYATIDCNLTESSVRDRSFHELQWPQEELVSYPEHRGHEGLRNLLAERYKVQPEHVLMTVGAASALFIVNTCFLDRASTVAIAHPNYATNRETPKLLQSPCIDLNLQFDSQYQLPWEALESALQSGVQLLSLTYPHNPTGAVLSLEDWHRLIELVEKYQTPLLMDETYREMRPNELPLAASLSPNVISISSVSKSYGLPGLRVGWLVTQNEKWMHQFLAAKEQIFICGSLLDESVVFNFLQNGDKKLMDIRNEIKEGFGILKDWIAQTPHFDWVEPQGGCVAFPKIIADVEPQSFYDHLNKNYSTFVGPGYWFESDPKHFRIGYAYPKPTELIRGLQNLHKTVEDLI